MGILHLTEFRILMGLFMTTSLEKFYVAGFNGSLHYGWEARLPIKKKYKVIRFMGVDASLLQPLSIVNFAVIGWAL